MIFNVIFGWDWGTPAILQQNPNKSTLGKLDQNLGLADPPPKLGQKPKFFQKSDLKAPLSVTTWMNEQNKKTDEFKSFTN